MSVDVAMTVRATDADGDAVTVEREVDVAPEEARWRIALERAVYLTDADLIAFRDGLTALLRHHDVVDDRGLPWWTGGDVAGGGQPVQAGRDPFLYGAEQTGQAPMIHRDGAHDGDVPQRDRES